MNQDNSEETLKGEILEWRKSFARAVSQRERLRLALHKICHELQCPAMEYLNDHIQKTWGEAFKTLEQINAEIEGKP